MNKEEELKNLIAEVPEHKERTVIFVETKRMTDFLASKLCQEDFPATSIHGDRAERARVGFEDFCQWICFWKVLG